MFDNFTIYFFLNEISIFIFHIILVASAGLLFCTGKFDQLIWLISKLGAKYVRNIIGIKLPMRQISSSVSISGIRTGRNSRNFRSCRSVFVAFSSIVSESGPENWKIKIGFTVYSH